jgi:hypothetical protein
MDNLSVCLRFWTCDTSNVPHSIQYRQEWVELQWIKSPSMPSISHQNLYRPLQGRLNEFPQSSNSRRQERNSRRQEGNSIDSTNDEHGDTDLAQVADIRASYSASRTRAGGSSSIYARPPFPQDNEYTLVATVIRVTRHPFSARMVQVLRPLHCPSSLEGEDGLVL